MRFWKRRSGVEPRSTLRGMAYTLVAIGAALWTAGTLAAPLLACTGAHPGASAVARLVYAPMCHQDTDRSWRVCGRPVSVCHRCSGIYAAFTTVLLVLPIAAGRLIRRLRMRKYTLAVFLLPVLLDYFLDVAGLLANSPVSRTATGALAGIGLALFVAIGTAELEDERRTRFTLSS